jgi:hypothetical protein
MLSLAGKAISSSFVGALAGANVPGELITRPPDTVHNHTDAWFFLLD